MGGVGELTGNKIPGGTAGNLMHACHRRDAALVLRGAVNRREKAEREEAACPEHCSFE